MAIDKEWLQLVAKLDFAFQPIVCAKSGKIIAVEAFVRKTEKIGFESIFSFFTKAFEKNELYNTDLLLRSKALHKFIQIEFENITMFYNLDSRILFDKNYSKGNTRKILDELNLKKKSICFEISDKGNIPSIISLSNILDNYKKEGFQIALDDFGSGVSCVELLYNSNPNFLKIDEFLIRSIESNTKKQIILHSMVSLAHKLGIKVIAKGIESAEELAICQKFNIDFVQGYYIQEPQSDIKNLEKQSLKVMGFSV